VSVVDASLLIDVLVGLPAGRPWRAWIASSDALAAPDCAGVELGRYLRRHTLSGVLDQSDANRSLAAFRALGVETYPTGPLLADAFALRENFTSDDGLYEPVATSDARLARAARRLGVSVVTPE
jgi:predicted nucleic acid-binding protein